MAFGKQAHYLTLYILKQPVFDSHRIELAGLSLGKGCIRFRRPDQIDWDVVTSLLADTLASGMGFADRRFGILLLTHTIAVSALAAAT